jgi:hypothetical protein
MRVSPYASENAPEGACTEASSMNATRPVRALLTELIDYAGLFPPASLDMKTAVKHYASCLSGNHAWMLGRFIVPAARMEEFETAASPYLADREWKISVLGITDRSWNGRGYVVDAMEYRPDCMEDIRSGPICTYIEVTPDRAWIEAIGKAGGRAKIRTGGVTADAFPAAAPVAEFQHLCHQAGVAFKATAGLHHPIRGVHPFTYEPGSARGVMHGFLNVFLAATLIYSGAGQQEAVRLLEEQSPDAFRFDEDAAFWRSFRLTSEQITDARQKFAIAFGSCSFEEPVSDLEALGLL